MILFDHRLDQVLMSVLHTIDFTPAEWGFPDVHS